MTDKQKAVLEAIKAFHVEHDYMPTLDELAKEFDVTIMTIKQHCDRLKAQGYLTWEAGRSRTFKILGKK